MIRVVVMPNPNVFAPILLCDICRQPLAAQHANWAWNMDEYLEEFAPVWVVCKKNCTAQVERQIKNEGGTMGTGEIEEMIAFLKHNLTHPEK